MDDPVKRLKELLGPPGNHPWAVLIPQILLWCFRRFCIDKIVSAQLPIIESMWSDYIELLVQYSPKGLETVASDWASPTNIKHLVTPISEFNRFFTDFITTMDTCLLNDDVETQDILSEFIDTQMSTIISDWVTEEYRELFIFPVQECEDDSISHTRIGQLIQSLLSYYENEVVHAEKEETQNLIYSSPVITPPHLLWRCVLPPKEEPAPEIQEQEQEQEQGTEEQGTEEQETQEQGTEEQEEHAQETQAEEQQTQEGHAQEQGTEEQEQGQEQGAQEQETQEEQVEEQDAQEEDTEEEDLDYQIQVGSRLPESDESRSSSPVMKANSTSAAFILRRETMRRSRMHGSSRVKTRKRYPHL